MSTRCCLIPCVLLAALATAAPAPAADTGYDVVAGVLTPFLGLFAEKGKGARAVSMTLRVEEAAGLPPELVGAEAEIALEPPNRFKVTAPFFAQRMTLCRNGQTVWVYPGSALKALLENPEIAAKLPKPNRGFKLAPFRLPLPAKQLVFLPALFQVREAPAATIDGVAYPGVDLKLMPELARSLKIADWSGTVWVDEEKRPVRIALVRRETRVVVRFARLSFARALPAQTWAPAAPEQGDVMLVPPARYDQLLRAILGERAED
jgi:hypothetical protein